MAIDASTLKSVISYHDGKRRPVFTLTNGKDIVPERIHAVNNCSVEVEEPGSVTIIPLDQIVTLRYVENVSIELDES